MSENPKEIEFKYDAEGYRDSLATVDDDGKRIWIYPKKPKGRFYNYRKYLSYVMLLVLFGLPWLKHNGQPLFLFNIEITKFEGEIDFEDTYDYEKNRQDPIRFQHAFDEIDRIAEKLLVKFK